MRTAHATIRETGGGGAYAPRRRAGFTLIEILFSVLIIFLLMGILLGGLRMATGASGRAADQATVANLHQGVEQLEQMAGGLIPPLVKDEEGPLKDVSGKLVPEVYSTSVPADLVFLRTAAPFGEQDKRYSVYSLPYYIMGVLDVDGVPGPGMKTPRRDGTFDTSPRTFEPFVDVGRMSKSITTLDAPNGKITLGDRAGVPLRYYRWEPEVTITKLADLNQPWLIASKSNWQWWNESKGVKAQKTEYYPAAADPSKTNAKYAIVGAGPNGVFGDESLDALYRALGVSVDASSAKNVNQLRMKAAEDNVVEVGS